MVCEIAYYRKHNIAQAIASSPNFALALSDNSPELEATTMDKLTVFTAKRDRTMDAGRPLAETVAVADGKVVSVGSLASMKPWLDRFDDEID